MDSFNYAKCKCTNKFYKNLLGFKFNADFLNRCLTRRKSRDKNIKGSVAIYEIKPDKDHILYNNHMKTPREREEFLFAFPFLIREYDNLRLVDTIGYNNPLLEDLCKATGIKYVCGNGMSTVKKDYLYEEKMHEYFHQWKEIH